MTATMKIKLNALERHVKIKIFKNLPFSYKRNKNEEKP